MNWTYISRRLAGVGIPLLLLSLTACGARMTPLNGGPIKGSHQGPVQRFDIDCRDTPTADGATELTGRAEIGSSFNAYYYGSCTYEGKPLPWKLLGIVHAGMGVTGDWEKFREGVAKQAENLGVPGNALRRFPVTVGDIGENIGALCIDPAHTP